MPNPRSATPPSSKPAILLLAAGLLSAPIQAEAPLFPTSRLLVPGLLEQGDYGLGFAWSGGRPALDNSRFQMLGSYAVHDRLDLGLLLIPDFGDQAVALAGQAGVDVFRAGYWTLGAVLGGSFSLGDLETYHFQHGTVRHGMVGAGLDLTAAWKWLYFGLGALYMRDAREYATAAPDPQTGRPELAGKYPDYDMSTSRQFLGARFGSDLKFNFEIAAMDEKVYNLWTEPSDPISTPVLTYGFAVTWYPTNRKPTLDSTAPKPPMGIPPVEKQPELGLPPASASLFDSRQYWRATGYGAMASALGLLAGVSVGSMVKSREYEFFPPEVWYGMAGAILAIPVGSVWGAYMDPRYQGKDRSLGWTAVGATGGFGASILLAPVTGGLSFYFALPVGTVMGFRYGLNK